MVVSNIVTIVDNYYYHYHYRRHENERGPRELSLAVYYASVSTSHYTPPFKRSLGSPQIFDHISRRFNLFGLLRPSSAFAGRTFVSLFRFLMFYQISFTSQKKRKKKKEQKKTILRVGCTVNPLTGSSEQNLHVKEKFLSGKL